MYFRENGRTRESCKNANNPAKLSKILITSFNPANLVIAHATILVGPPPPIFLTIFYFYIKNFENPHNF
ncbi:hypothetical protein CUU66_17950 [Peribacillus deserti]|uniref:Uncharacterized protein n=1 Tax=Peribacillus deserti TaxID=673318 RepID=A0A2N5M2H9_9BACI|nr:hypothetical protein CUU66_17950 [Peribacillus deserti]